MRRIKRALAAAIIALTLAINVACGKDAGPDDEEAPPISALAQQNVAYSAITAEAKKSEQRRNYGAYAAQLKEKRRLALAEKRERRRLELVELRRKRAAQLAHERSEKARQAVQKPSQAAISRSSNYVGQAQTFEATAYTAYCAGCSGITATGHDLRASIYKGGRRVIAVDPRLIPLGSIVQVTLGNGEAYEAIAEDTGGAIKGRIVDVAHADKASMRQFGRQSVQIRIIRRGR